MKLLIEYALYRKYKLFINFHSANEIVKVSVGCLAVYMACDPGDFLSRIVSQGFGKALPMSKVNSRNHDFIR